MIGECLTRIGQLCRKVDKFNEAYRQCSITDSIDITIVYENLALCYRKINKRTEALASFNESLLIYRAKYEINHKIVKSIEANIAEMNAEQQINIIIESIPEELNPDKMENKTKTPVKRSRCSDCIILLKKKHHLFTFKNVYAFDGERLEIEMKLLLNGYPPRFLKYHFDRFHQMIDVHMELDVQQYQTLHRKLLYLPTRQLVANNDVETKKQWDRKILMLPHTFEGGPSKDFNRQFRQLWTKYYGYKGSVVKDVRVMVTAMTNSSLNDLFVRKKPSTSLLTKMEVTDVEKLT
ncbi:unnamed protein product [Adineta ricciae]|uniref:Uncharacterized protein n=1 Tax=Adineta ricciae TaxID=249248 RepID=A0A815LXP2_ADIRI|nr:unnamed protein product [Adineta ricciae]CAF1524533.1 unnamed protein product [Adineta ricciae]